MSGTVSVVGGAVVVVVGTTCAVYENVTASGSCRQRRAVAPLEGVSLEHVAERGEA